MALHGIHEKKTFSVTWMVALGLALAILASPALAHDDHSDDAAVATEAAHQHDGPAVDNTGYFNAYVFDFELLVKKFYGLAAAIPAEHYGWRPSDEVRSLSENLMHVAAGNFRFAKMLGVETPADLPEDLEKVTDKEEVLKIFRTSIHTCRDIIESHRNVDLEGRDIEFFGGNTKPRQLLFLMLAHMHEHLGQTIAYARTNHVAPPWDSPLATNLDKP